MKFKWRTSKQTVWVANHQDLWSGHCVGVGVDTVDRSKVRTHKRAACVLRSECRNIRNLSFFQIHGWNRAGLKKHLSNQKRRSYILTTCAPSTVFLHLTLAHGLICYKQMTYLSRVRRSWRSPGWAHQTPGKGQTCKQRCLWAVRTQLEM